MGMVEAQYVRVEPEGAVAVAQVLREKITEHENQAIFHDLSEAAEKSGFRLAVDLGQVGLLSSAGLGGLITLHKLCAAKGGRLVIFGVQDPIIGLMKMTRLDRLLVIVADRAGAVKKAAA
jgi:anti-sigma B factor antagonist